MANDTKGTAGCILTGLKKGWQGLIWLLKILIPVSFLTALLVHFGLIYKLNFLLDPLMTLMGLPASAALVLVIGIFTGIYGTVAALSVMPFAMDHMTLMAIFTLISHNLIQESIVQGNSGLNPFLAGTFRLAMAFGVTAVCAKIMGTTPGTGETAAMGLAASGSGTFTAMVLDWAAGAVKLTIQIFCIIMPLMVAIELAKHFNIIRPITVIFAPVLSILGLNRSCGMLWLTGAVFGLAYGAAVIVEETRTNHYSKTDLTRLHLSLGVNHAMIEDPALFLPLGLPVFWLWVPRLIAALVAAWLFSALSCAWRFYAKRNCHKKICNH